MQIRIIIAISLIYSGILYGQYFLKEYKDIRLGMSREELQGTRPNAEPFGFEEETSDLLVEKVSVDEIKGTVMYGFDEDTLVSFMMGSESENLEDATDLLKGIFSNYSGYEILSVKPMDDGIIKFNTNKTYDSFLSIALPKDKSNQNKSVISYQVVDDEFSKRINLEEAFKSNGYDKAAFESFKARVAAFAEETLSDREDNDADAALRRLRPWLGLLFLFCALTGILVVIFRQSGAAARKRKPCR